MKILLKILVAPFALALSLLAALLVFLFDICAVLLTITSVILVVLGIALFFTPTPIGGIVFLFLALFCLRSNVHCYIPDHPASVLYLLAAFGMAFFFPQFFFISLLTFYLQTFLM